jgi:hypothetical protein
VNGFYWKFGEFETRRSRPELDELDGPPLRAELRELIPGWAEVETVKLLDPDYSVDDRGSAFEPGHEGHRLHWHAAHGNAGYACSCGEEFGCFSYVWTEELGAWFEAAPPCPVCGRERP